MKMFQFHFINKIHTVHKLKYALNEQTSIPGIEWIVDSGVYGWIQLKRLANGTISTTTFLDQKIIFLDVVQ